MCGVIGLIYEAPRPDLGRIASELLKTLEYRGYDSTGAAIQGEGEAVDLRKAVGAPSVMVEELGIVRMAGQILCGQVRWATFGAVTDENAQPHEVRCKTHLYGAHNGNVTNCDALKAWLGEEGHRVRSDNDGEMVVHTVEHLFARELEALAGDAERRDPARRRACMRAALCAAAARLQGSYAAVIVDPVSRTLFAVKQGSSLYFGLGRDETGARFTIASSDLSSVLKLTRVVVPLAEGEFIEHDALGYQVHAIAARGATPAGAPLERRPVRSRLRAKDIALLPPFETFMDQEISAQERTARDLVTLFLGGTEAVRVLRPYIEASPADAIALIAEELERLRDQYADEHIRELFHALVDRPAFRALLASIPEAVKREGTSAPAHELADRMVSSEAGFFADLLGMARDRDDLLAVRSMDVILERAEVAEFAIAVERFTELCAECLERGGRIYVVSCGSSFHAAKAAALFMNELACAEIVPILPGEFRGQYARAIGDGDLLCAVSQSGETKDLIDVMNYVIGTGRAVRRVALVNNVSSTLAQEKSELVIPLRCGPEIAVPATKSFMNQMVAFYCLALRLAERRLASLPLSAEERAAMERELGARREKLPALPRLIRDTFDTTDAELELAARQLFLCPSLHILATRLSAVAKEGALKVREVVLNHTEGFEGSEFKHGPNTILGFNTVFGPTQVDALLRGLGQALDRIAREAGRAGLDGDSHRRLLQAATDSVFSAAAPFALSPREAEVLARGLDRGALVEALYADYPLIYVSGPDEQDLALTVSQINTHKIRGASTVVIAEDHPALRQAAQKPPADNPGYRSVYVTLPRTNDTLMTVFSATVVLQRLALKMSLLKQQYLDRLGIKDHGVHPDVPKNVSKSITVD
jgi:glucosamine 6-phosphate synthetase-like amidotransferase/phosphosugar isomerase protein